MTNLNPGDRVTTPTHRTGIILQPPWTMPHHCLVQIDGMDNPIWLLSSILELLERCPAQPEPQPAAEPSPVLQIAQLSLFSEDAAA